MKENKKVSPSLGVCGRNGAAAGRKILHFALCFLALFTFILPAEAINWSSQGSQPNGGSQYYIYNTGTGRFLTSSGTTADPLEAHLFTLSGSGRGTLTIGSYAWTVDVSSGNYYCYRQEGPWYWRTTYYLRVNGEVIQADNTSSSAGNLIFVFITPSTYNSLKKTLYAKATSSVGSVEGGTAYVSFTSPVTGSNTEANTNITLFEPSYIVTAYFEANANDNFEFVGWAHDAEGTQMIVGAVNLTYSEDFEVTSIDENNPTTLPTRYAIYAAVSPYEAQVVHLNDNGEEVITTYDYLSDAINAAEANDKVQLLKNINLSSTLTMSKSITLDLNGYSLRRGGNVLTVSDGELTLTDSNPKADNGIILTSSTAENAVKVQGGKFTFFGGRIDGTNSTTGAVLVSGGTFVMRGQGGEVIANAGYGVQVNNGTSATLAQGTINATNGTVGVIANGTVNITHSIRINSSAAATAVGVRVNNASANVTIDGGVISATATGANAYAIQAQNGAVVCEGNMEAKASATSGTYAIKQEGSTATVTVNTGRFWTNNANTKDVTAATASKLVLKGGYYVNDEGLTDYRASSGISVAEFTTPKKFKDAGYNYILSDGENPNYVAFTANGKKFSTLENALEYANLNANTTMTIMQVVAEYEFDVAGNYTLPAKATLLIPYEEQTAPQTALERTSGAGPTPFTTSKLTIASGVHLAVFGTVEVGGKQAAGAQGANGAGYPSGSHGLIVLNPGSSMAFSGNSAVLRAWGFITGNGTIDVRRGAKVYEHFQMYDWKGGSAMSKMFENTKKVFPVTQYFIQNVESPTTYHPGSQLIGATSVQVSDYTLAVNDILLIGTSGALFLMKDEADQENTWVRKSYDAALDKQVYEVNSSASLGSLVIDVSAPVKAIIDNAGLILGGIIELALGAAGIDPDNLKFDSRKYTLPLTNNMKIVVRSGNLDITQNTILLPGAEIEVMKTASATVLDESSITYDGAFYLVDADQWRSGNVFSGAVASQVLYTAAHKGKPNKRGTITGGNFSFTQPADPKLFVHGTFNIDGVIYTTTNSEMTSGGANITSTIKDAGTFNLRNQAPSASGSVSIFSGLTGSKTDTEIHYDDLTAVSAWLKNEKEGKEPTKTAGMDEGISYCFMDIDGDHKGEWVSLTTAGCFVIDEAADPDVFYAKPKEYVQVSVAVLNEDNPDLDIEYVGILDNEGHDTHMFNYTSSLYPSSGDTVLICMADCQWWKVIPVEESDSLVYSPTSGLYYFWNENRREGNDIVPGWDEKRFTVKWLNHNGSTLATYQQAYKSVPSYQSTTPTKNPTAYFTYAFAGWNPEITEETRVMGNTSFTAVFEEHDRKYTISFYDEDGELIESQQCKMGDVPVCYNMPSKDGMRLEWLPNEPIAVNGNADYHASFTAEEKSAYTITFFDFNGDVLQSSEVAVGAMPVYDETNGTPSKPSVGSDTYVWNGGWTPEIAAVDRNASYTATFDKVPAKYTITWQDKDGNEIEHADWGYGEIPVCSNPPTKAPTVAEYYEVIWNPLVSSVTGNQTYRENGFTAYKNTCRLTVNAGANGKVALAGSESVLTNVYEFGTEVAISATANEHYHFVRWSDGNTDASRTVVVNAAITLVAEFAIDQVQISWNWANDDVNPRVDVQTLDYGAMPSHGTPVKNPTPGYTYTFADWDKPIVEATSNTTYTAIYTPVAVQYTIRFIYNNGREDFVKAYDNGSTPIITNPTKTQDGMNYIFAGWKNTAGEVTLAGVEKTTLPIVDKLETYTAQYSLITGEGTPNDIVLDDPTSLEDLIIHTNGSVEAVAGAPLTVNNLYLEATSEESGQLLGSNVSAVNAYFDWTMNGTTGSVRRTWYAVAVPWEVDARTGITEKATGRTLTAGRDFDLIYYNGATRASEGNVASCWEYVQWDIQGHDRQGNPREVDNLLHPGRLYMMYFAAEGLQTVRFEKAAGADVMYMGTLNVSEYSESTDNEGKDANWNGIANPRTYFASLSAGTATYAQVLNNGNLDDYFAGESSPVYQTINLGASSFMVGKPIFLQATGDDPVVVTKQTTAGIVNAAPRRNREESATPEGIDAVYQLTIAAEGKPSSDNLFVQVAEDEKADKYVIGKDLSKGGVAAKRAQMWVDRYNTKLSVNTQMLVNDEATYPLVLFAPAAGEYTISTVQSTMSNEDYDLYLTLNGQAIWNLANGDYTMSLPQGNTADYGLRISARKSPTVATGIDEAVVDAKGETQKVLINNQVFIIRGEKVYTVEGQLVK